MARITTAMGRVWAALSRPGVRMMKIGDILAYTSGNANTIKSNVAALAEMNLLVIEKRSYPRLYRRVREELDGPLTPAILEQIAAIEDVHKEWLARGESLD